MLKWRDLLKKCVTINESALDSNVFIRADDGVYVFAIDIEMLSENQPVLTIEEIKKTCKCGNDGHHKITLDDKTSWLCNTCKLKFIID